MWPLILLGLVIFLIAIVISVVAYPFICASIAIASKKYNAVVTGILLALTLVLYLFACTTLENAFDNWCYSVYTGIVITPFVLFLCTGLENPQKWPESGESPQHVKMLIPVMSFLTSILFAIEGCLRMSHSTSIHMLINNGLNISGDDSYWLYFDGFQYAGALLFFVSIISASIIGFSSVRYHKDHKRELEDEQERRSRIEGEIKEITQKLTTDCDCLTAYLSEQRQEINPISCYNNFCQDLISSLKSSDEIYSNVSYEYGSFNNVNTDYKVLLVKTHNKNFYFYPMGIVVEDKYVGTLKVNRNNYKYIPVGRTTLSISGEMRNRNVALPSDVSPMRRYWLHTCKDGSPDRRYSYNPPMFVYDYRIISIDELKFSVYRVNTANQLIESYQKLYSQISHVRTFQQHIKSIRTQENKNQESNNIATSSKTIEIPKEEKVTSDKNNDIKQFVYDNPETLEECFISVMRKQNSNILKDKSLAKIINNQYTKLDITEYKEVIEQMAQNDFFYQFLEVGKQNDFALYNISSSFARKHKLNTQKCLYITQALVAAIKKYNKTKE